MLLELGIGQAMYVSTSIPIHIHVQRKRESDSGAQVWCGWSIGRGLCGGGWGYDCWYLFLCFIRYTATYSMGSAGLPRRSRGERRRRGRGGRGEVKRREKECWARRTNEKHDQLCGNQGDPPLLSNSSHGIQQDWHHCVVEVSSSAERLHVHSWPSVGAGLTLTFQHFLQEETQNGLYRYPQPQRLPCRYVGNVLCGSLALSLHLRHCWQSWRLLHGSQAFSTRRAGTRCQGVKCVSHMTLLLQAPPRIRCLGGEEK